MKIWKEPFGITKNGECASKYFIENKNGTRVEVTDFGITLLSLRYAGKDVILGYDGLCEYESQTEYLGATVVLDMSDESNPKLINTPVKSTFCVAYDQIEFPDSTTAKIKGTDVTIDLSEFNQATLRKDVLIDVDGNYAGAWESAASKNNTSREFTRNTTKDFIFSKITLVNPETGEENVQDLIAFGVAKGTFN